MAWYGYGNRSGHNSSGVASGADELSKASYASDHVCRPVIIDYEGRKMPIIVCTSNSNAQSYLADTVEHVRRPLVTEYTYGSPPKVEPVKQYGYKPSSPPKAEPVYYGHRPSSPPYEKPEDVHSYRRSSPPKPIVEPVKTYGYKPQPVKDYGYKAEPAKDYQYNDDNWRRSSSPAHGRPQEVEDFISKVQTEASQPNRFGSLGASSRGQTPQSNGQNGIPGYGGYSGYNSNKYSQKPSGNTIRNENYDDYYDKKDIATEPTMITNGSWARPSRSAWAAPPTNDATLGKPTSDIATAVENLKEAAKALSVTNAPPQFRYTVPVSTVPTRDTYPETIDSREAAKRYGNFSLSSGHTGTDTYTTTIDSREAVKKYGGARIA